MEQDLKLRTIWDALNKPSSKKEDIITVFMALQEQNFILANSLTNLVTLWTQETRTPEDLTTTKEAEEMFGILFENKD